MLSFTVCSFRQKSIASVSLVLLVITYSHDCLDVSDTHCIDRRRRCNTSAVTFRLIMSVCNICTLCWMLYCLIDGTDVLYNKFNVDSSSPPDNPPQHPNSDYNCVVATTGQWRVSRCDQQHRVTCQSDTLTGIMTTCLHYNQSSVHVFSD